MEKKLLKTREDFIEWQNYCKNVVYDRDSVKFEGEEEDEPKEYPCMIVFRTFLYTLHYCFVYSSDIVV